MVRFLANYLYKPLLVKWLSVERTYTYRNIRLQIPPEVFHPGFFHSTHILLRWLSRQPLQGKKLLELGAGSGLISISAAKAGARVTATDINPVAIAYLHKNSEANQVSLEIIKSDLFADIPLQVFDIIAINPPYYVGQPKNYQEYAWYCGPNSEYFSTLFQNLSNYQTRNTVIVMVLCEGSKRDKIQLIAEQYGFRFECIRVIHNVIERNYLYRVHLVTNQYPEE